VSRPHKALIWSAHGEKHPPPAGLDLLKGRKVKLVITSEYGLVRHTTRLQI